MKVEVNVSNMEDSIEAEFFLKDLRKLREQSTSKISKDFTITIYGKFKV
jgi:hypothetical protein